MTTRRSPRCGFRPTLEALEDRQVPTVAATSAVQAAILTGPVRRVDWFDLNLSDGAVRSLARTEFNRDLAITRNDMVAILRQVETDGVVSGAELSDLKTLAANGTAVLHMPAYVQFLTNKVANFGASIGYVIPPPVNTNQHASALVVGSVGQTTFGDDYATPNLQHTHIESLQAGDPAENLQALAGKWFFGMDLPDTSQHYSRATSSSLFGSGIAYTDIHQGIAGDCYFLAGVATVAHQSPGTIKNRFIDNGDGTYTIRFFDNQNAPTFVTVNKFLPVEATGYLVYAGSGQSITNPSLKLWVALLEKAFYQEARFEDSFESYDTAGGDPGLATLHLTGQAGGGLHRGLDQSMFASAVNSGQLVCLTTGGAIESDDIVTTDGFRIVRGHAYAVVGHSYDAEFHRTTYTIFNPWGLGNGQATARFDATWAQIQSIFSGFSNEINPALPASADAYRAMARTYAAFIAQSSTTATVGAALTLQVEAPATLNAGDQALAQASARHDAEVRDLLFEQLASQGKDVVVLDSGLLDGLAQALVA